MAFHSGMEERKKVSEGKKEWKYYFYDKNKRRRRREVRGEVPVRSCRTYSPTRDKMLTH